jgi:hypothetical protein
MNNFDIGAARFDRVVSIEMFEHMKNWPRLLAGTYGAGQQRKWWGYWRVFFMSCAELFAWQGGEEWFVGHYLMQKPAGVNCRG